MIRTKSMITVQTASLTELYDQDETAWLESMVRLLGRGLYAELDYQNLKEYLSDMAKRDRREVHSRLTVLLAHLLKWGHQPEMQTGSWRATIYHQRLELRLLLDSKTLLNHARNVLADAYADARKQAAVETEMKLSKFPKECPWSVEEVLSDD